MPYLAHFYIYRDKSLPYFIYIFAYLTHFAYNRTSLNALALRSYGNFLLYTFFYININAQMS